MKNMKEDAISISAICDYVTLIEKMKYMMDIVLYTNNTSQTNDVIL